jgi:pimeloyl-ACP methyl ester carboxylesterase
MNHKQIIYNNAVFSYYTSGNGKPVLLMHGFAEDHSIWSHQIQSLSEKYYVITPDLMGTNKSTSLEKEKVSIVDYAMAIKEIIIAEQIDKLIMIGHSMGGYITLAYYKLYPEDLVAIGLVHSTIFADDHLKKEIRSKAIDFIREYGSNAFLKTSISGLFHDIQKHELDIKHMIQKSDCISEKSLIQYYQAMRERPDQSQLLSESKIPVMYIAGIHDQAVPFSVSQKQFHVSRISYVKILKKSAHMGMIEETENVNRYLSFFIDNQHIK